ncbi:recombinase family protein [Bradyrhizobium stylosanthis]|uniref:recombinase family protein n=1 Tax=Bradyrhizobium stylosanthis TaxID=1803665 RepID=UPI001FEFCFB2|nr:recombinase family protein [Bradyrhizobium stylosanthis]
MKYGYARVSTSEQDHAGQVDALKVAGAVKVFSEKMSGVRADRPQLARAIAALDQDDVLSVTRIDRLARSSRDLLNIVHEIEARGATFESLSEPWANTNTPTASAMLTMLSAFAQLDRAFILARTKEGRERAKANGRGFGRKPKLMRSRSRMRRTCNGKGAACAKSAHCLAAMRQRSRELYRPKKQEEEESA